jgi:alpha/beta superfamily hydrolase
MLETLMARKTIPFTFPSGRGQTLAGLIDLPPTAPRAWGVFGPCFTCVKESLAATKICRALAGRGIAMLRFDTMGVGGSTGSIAVANFTTRVGDLRAACVALAAHHKAPRLLVGHSLSGPAAIAAVKHVPSVDIVATVCAPADPARVIEKFRRTGVLKEKGDIAEIDVLGKIYKFDKSFVADMLSQRVAEDTGALKKKLFVFHAPNDSIVSFEESDVIMSRAKNAELVRLDDQATHLFNTRDDDAEFVAETLARALM